MASWRGRLAVMASRGEVDGPRVAEAKAALSNWRLRNFLTRDCGYTPPAADALIDREAKLAATQTPREGR
jgi:hypothetical protein